MNSPGEYPLISHSGCNSTYNEPNTSARGTNQGGGGKEGMFISLTAGSKGMPQENFQYLKAAVNTQTNIYTYLGWAWVMNLDPTVTAGQKKFSKVQVIYKAACQQT